jgi:DNA-binding NarL/FixJ family response regulator
MLETKIKTILVDDEQIALDRIKILLDHFPEIEILETTTNALRSTNIICKHEPDLVFLDVEMPGKTGLEIADELQKNSVFAKIIFVTSHDHYAIEAIKNNAFDYILKPVSINMLKDAINRYKSKLHLNLSKREVDIIRLVAKGLNSKEIGAKLYISKHTVDTHRRKILDKTNCKNAVDLVRYASKYNLI